MATEDVNKTLSVPPYPEMILKALEALNEKDGSSRSAITKYIESNYSELPEAHSALLTQHLNKMKEGGELVLWKNNYSKPDPNAPPRRGRGRPPKPKLPMPPGSVLSSPRPRGRPPKDPNAPPKPKVSSGRPRGRPKKLARSTTPGSATAASGGKPRGRPPKVKPSLPEVSVEQ